jgi:hypothetical protein
MIAGAYRPLSAEQVVEVERRLGASLPADYKQFVLEFGECRFEDDVLVRVDGSEDIPLDVFYGAPDPARPRGDLLWILEGEFEPPRFLQFASDFLGDRLVLDAVTGRVYWRNYYSATGESEPVASSFTDLLDRMYADPLAYE